MRMKTLTFACIALTVNTFQQTVLCRDAGGASVAIFGDSLATAAGAHPALAFDSDVLWDILKGERHLSETAPLAVHDYLGSGGNPAMGRPLNLLPGSREYRGAFGWVFQAAMDRLADDYFNAPWISWGFLSARKSGVPAERILIAAHNGARMSDLSRQADRVLDHLKGQLPDRSYLLFTGNDLCGAHMHAMTTAESFRISLSSGLKYMIINGKAAPAGSEIFVMAYLGVTQLLIKEELLDKRIQAFGHDMTCRQLRARSYQPRPTESKGQRHQESLYFSHLIPPDPASYCPTLFALPMLAKADDASFLPFLNKGSQSHGEVSPVDREAGYLEGPVRQRVDEMISVLSGRIRQFREVAEQVVEEVSEWSKHHVPDSRIRVRYVSETEQISFDPDDIAADCFHLSPYGQLKIAKALDTSLSKAP